MDRGALYTNLFELAKDLDEGETTNVENWLKNGGEFPSPTPRNQPPAALAQTIGPTGDDDEAGEEFGDWPEYNPEDFETGSSEVEEDVNEDEEDDESGENQGEQEQDTGAFFHPGDLVEDLEDQDDDDFRDEDDEINEMDPRARRAALRGKASGPLMECLICADEFDKTEFPESTQITSNCHHKNDERVCVYCLQQSIATAVAEGQLHLIICPFCPEKLSHNEVKLYATREVFARYFPFPPRFPTSLTLLQIRIPQVHGHPRFGHVLRAELRHGSDPYRRESDDGLQVLFIQDMCHSQVALA
jgi:hypothetical protein